MAVIQHEEVRRCAFERTGNDLDVASAVRVDLIVVAGSTACEFGHLPIARIGTCRMHVVSGTLKIELNRIIEIVGLQIDCRIENTLDFI